MSDRSTAAELTPGAVDAIPLGDADFSLVLDDRGVIAGCNEAFARWLGHPGCDALRGRSLAETLDPASRPKLDRALSSLGAGAPRTAELNHVAADGRLLLGRYHFFPPRSLGPDQANIVAFGSDGQRSLGVLEELIDLKRDREAQLARVRALNDRLERQNADLAALSHMVKHDVSNSLNAVQLIGAVLEGSDGSDPGHDRDLAREIGGLCRHISGILHGFVDLADLGRRPLSARRVDLAASARAMVDLVAARRPDVAFRVSFDLAAPAAWADPNHLRQVFENLVSNAFKYRDPARPTLELRIAGRPRGDRVVLEVADNGLGIPEGRRAAVFDLFGRAHEGVAEGHGVGLAIVKRLVEVNGGSIALESAEGVGSTFRITLPTLPGTAVEED